MNARKITIGLLIISLTAVSFYSGLLFNGTRVDAINVQENTTETVNKTFLKDGDEILSPSEWINKSLREISEIKPGMTRAVLKKSFSPEGGLSHPTQRGYLYRNCSIKIDVEFKRAEGKEASDEQGRLLGGEYDDDVITKVSRAYLSYGAND